MAATNRAAKITKLVSLLKKQYKPAPAPPKDRPLLDTLLFASLLENSPHDTAAKVFASLQDTYFDWNEVRVTTKQELAEACKPLSDPDKAAERLKGTLQSLFEAFYAFDIESMKKQNLGQSIQQLEKLPGTTRFIVSYGVQNSLGGHSIPINDGSLIALVTLGVISDAEAAAGSVPGLERAVPKNKGVEIGSLIHQLGVDVGKNPYGQTARKRLLAIDPKCKDRLPKRPPKPEPTPEPPPAPKPKPAPEKKTAKAGAPKTSPAPAEKPAAKKKAAPTKKAAPAKKAAANKAPAKKKVVKKKVLKKKVVGKKATKKTKKTTGAKKTVKKKTTPAKATKKTKKKVAAGKRKPR